jgi:hypothetical protein
MYQKYHDIWSAIYDSTVTCKTDLGRWITTYVVSCDKRSFSDQFTSLLSLIVLIELVLLDEILGGTINMGSVFHLIGQGSGAFC